MRDIWRDLQALGLLLHPFDLAEDGPEGAAINEIRRASVVAFQRVD